jgi:DNA-binding transcriptional LysR family regulator
MQEHLDLSAVEAFVFVANLRSFTHAAEALGMTQAGISLKLKKLERVVGYRLLERTPRHICLSAEGEIFMWRAQELLSIQRLALNASPDIMKKIHIGVSDYIAGPGFPRLLACLATEEPTLTIEARLGASSDLLRDFDADKIDAVIVREERRRRDGEELFIDEYGWFASPNFGLATEGRPMPLITVSDTCGMRAIATRLLMRDNIAFENIYIAGSLTNVIAAVAAGLGVAPLPVRLAPVGAVDIGDRRHLPALPASSIVLHTLARQRPTLAVLRRLASGLVST